MLIVVNSGPLISLARIGQLDLLHQLFGKIVVPVAVYREVTRDEGLPGARAISEADWLSVVEVSNLAMVDRLSFWLDAGESEVLSLAQELGLDSTVRPALRGGALDGGGGVGDNWFRNSGTNNVRDVWAASQRFGFPVLRP